MVKLTKLTVAFCTYNRSSNLPCLIEAIRNLKCVIPFDILVVDNNSSDDTQSVLKKLAELGGPQLRFVKETQQGIPYARNRALLECMEQDYMLFLDDDELPEERFVEAAYDAFSNENAECVGGRVKICFPGNIRPNWFENELLGFLAAVDHGDNSFWIKDKSTPIWTANVGYRMSLFRDDESLRFDHRYNRIGNVIGGGSDAIMFRDLLSRNVKIRYRPDMVVDHYVEAWRLTRIYFLKLHFISGRKKGEFELGGYAREFFGIPPFLVFQFFSQCMKTLIMYVFNKKGKLRQAMNASNALGILLGRIRRWSSTNK